MANLAAVHLPNSYPNSFGSSSTIFNSKLSTPIVFQDRTSVVTLVTQGGGVTQTRHLFNCLHLAKETVDEKQLIIEHCKANLMITDGFTKPFDEQ